MSAAWVKVHNSMPSNPKLLLAGERAGWLYVCGLCYSNEHLTNGFIASHVLPVVAPGMKNPERLAASLVAAGLWHPEGPGWRIHDYEDHQRSAEEIKTTRNWDAERKAFFRDRALVGAIRARDGDHCRYCGRQVNWQNRRGELGGTYDHVIPRGGNTLENVVVACKRCNSRKGARTPTQAGMPLRDPDPDLDPDPDPGLDPRARSDLARVEQEENRREKTTTTSPLRSDVRACFTYWQERCEHPHAKLTSDRRSRIEARLRDGYTPELIRQAIDGAALAAFVNDAGKRFDDIELICRSGSKLESFVDRTGDANVVRLSRPEALRRADGWKDAPEYRGGAS